MKTKFPEYRILIMKDEQGNMNEIYKTSEITEDDYKWASVLSIEEAIEFQKENPNKIFSLWEDDPKEVIDYLKKSNANFVY